MSYLNVTRLWDFTKRVFGSKGDPFEQIAPKEHDFKFGRWGWHIESWDKYDPSKDPSKKPGIKFVGHGYGLRRRDTFRIRMQSGRVGRWRINELKYERDPLDMFWLTATLEGYSDD